MQDQGWLVEWGFYALSASKAIFRARTYNCNLFSPVMMMNETRRKPTTGRQSPSLFDKWHGIFYMPSRIDEAGHTKAFDYPVVEHWGEVKERNGPWWDSNPQVLTPMSPKSNARPRGGSEDHSSDTRNTTRNTSIPLTKLKFDMIRRGSFD